MEALLEDGGALSRLWKVLGFLASDFPVSKAEPVVSDSVSCVEGLP